MALERVIWDEYGADPLQCRNMVRELVYGLCCLERGTRRAAEPIIMKGEHMDRTDEMLVDLMGDLDVELLADDYMEADLKRKKTAWLAAFFREKSWRRDDAVESAQIGVQGITVSAVETAKEKKRPRHRKLEHSPLSYEWGEAIRTDMGKRLRNGVHSVKRRAAALWGFVSGVLTMALIALSFLALLDKKKRAV